MNCDTLAPRGLRGLGSKRNSALKLGGAQEALEFEHVRVAPPQTKLLLVNLENWPRKNDFL